MRPMDEANIAGMATAFVVAVAPGVIAQYGYGITHIPWWAWAINWGLAWVVARDTAAHVYRERIAEERE